MALRRGLPRDRNLAAVRLGAKTCSHHDSGAGHVTPRRLPERPPAGRGSWRESRRLGMPTRSTRCETSVLHRTALPIVATLRSWQSRQPARRARQGLPFATRMRRKFRALHSPAEQVSILREPGREEYPLWNATAPEKVFAASTYARNRPLRPTLAPVVHDVGSQQRRQGVLGRMSPAAKRMPGNVSRNHQPHR